MQLSSGIRFSDGHKTAGLFSNTAAQCAHAIIILDSRFVKFEADLFSGSRVSYRQLPSNVYQGKVSPDSPD